jgi:myo-inositol 2-dehydrogenase / D-chiro-inositol 1-dehydrogenase
MGIKVGFIGTGRIYRTHLAALRKIEGIEITSVCDIIPEVVEKAAKEISAKSYLDYREMLDKEKLDAVWICTPANIHTENVLYCIDKKVPFFLEKPAAMTEKEGDKVASKIRETKIYHSVGYKIRYSPAIEKLKELLASEQVIFPAAEYFWTIPLVDSIKSKENAGGQIVDQATHLIDLFRYVVGEIKSVYTGRSRGFFPEEKLYTGDDASSTVFEFESGISGSLLCTYALFPEITQYFPPRIEIICKKKLIDYTLEHKFRVITREKEEKFEYEANSFYLEDKSFIEGLRSRNSSAIRSSYEDALKTLKVCLAANRSMETGSKITL